jgi:hypothetical protein
MNYRRLTTEQFESLSDEFINYLSVQGITSDMWAEYKESRLDQVDAHLDEFSDLIWKGVLSSLKYLEQISAQHIHLFKLEADAMHLIAIKVFNPRIDLSTASGFEWFKKNYQDDAVEYLTATKKYSDNPNLDKFELIEKGANITKGELYEWFADLIDN